MVQAVVLSAWLLPSHSLVAMLYMLFLIPWEVCVGWKLLLASVLSSTETFLGLLGQCELPRLMRYFGEDMITQDCPERWMHPRNNYFCLKKTLGFPSHDS